MNHVSIKPVSPEVDKLAGEVGRLVEAQSGDVYVVVVCLIQPAESISDQYEPVDNRQRYQQLAGRGPSKLGRRDENTDGEGVADEPDGNDNGQCTEVNVEANVFDHPNCLVRRRRLRQPVRRTVVSRRRRRHIASLHHHSLEFTDRRLSKSGPLASSSTWSYIAIHTKSVNNVISIIHAALAVTSTGEPKLIGTMTPPPSYLASTTFFHDFH